MRKNELHALQGKCPPGRDFDTFLFEQMGLPLPHMRALEQDLLDDLDPKVYGVGWWTQYGALGDKRRILIGDYLCQSVASIPDNVLEAKLHLYEALDWWGQLRKQMRNAVSFDATGRPKLKPKVVAVEALPDRMPTLHMAGFFRAVNSACDGLGAAIVGIAALPLRILKTDLQQARTNLRSIDPGGSPRDRIRAGFAMRLQEVIDQAGPKGWLEWATAFRHMLVHRGRRMHFGSLYVTPSPILDPRGRRGITTAVRPRLAAEPAWCDVDAMRQHGELMLGENAPDTVHGILESVVFLLEQASVALLELWRTRRGDPAVIEQPLAQWPCTDPPDAIGFTGYASRPDDPGDSMIMRPRDIRRFQAAAVLNDGEREWARFT